MGVGAGNARTGAGETPIGLGITPACPRDLPGSVLFTCGELETVPPRTWAGEIGATSAVANITAANVMTCRMAKSYPLLGCPTSLPGSAFIAEPSLLNPDKEHKLCVFCNWRSGLQAADAAQRHHAPDNVSREQTDHDAGYDLAVATFQQIGEHAGNEHK